MGNLDRITIDPTKMNGQPCIRDLRLTVRRVLKALALYPDREEFWREYPELDDEDIRQALEFAAAVSFRAARGISRPDWRHGYPA